MFKTPTKKLAAWRNYYYRNKERLLNRHRKLYYANLKNSRKAARESYSRNRKNILIQRREWAKKNRAKVKAYRATDRYRELTRKHNQKARDRIRNWHLQCEYGISIEQFNQMRREQRDKCAICKKPEMSKSRWGTRFFLRVDHCHETGLIRGLLCARCNSALGFVGDDIDLLKNMIKYLSSARCHC